MRTRQSPIQGLRTISIDRFSPFVRVRPVSSLALSQTVMRRGSFGRLDRVLERRFGRSIETRMVAQGLSVEEVTWRTANGRSSFTFDPAVFSHPYGGALIERWLDILPLLMEVLSLDDGMTGSTSIALGDCGTGRGLSFCDHRPDAWLIPDPVFMREEGYHHRKEILAEQAPVWADRHPRALWRGQTSGWHDAAGEPIGTWADLPRVRLCRLGRDPEHRGLIDAGITGVVQIGDPEAVRDIRNSGLMVPRIEWRRFSEWRYQIDIDGNTASWEGLFTKLCTGSPVLKVASGFGFRQWYHDRLVPWVHVVPVEADLSDLVEKIRWLRRHDDGAEAIGRAGRALADAMDLSGEMLGATETIRRALHAST